MESYVTSLFKEQKEFVYRQVFTLTRSRWHSEEILQEVFLRVWLHRDKLSSIKCIRSWLYIITKRISFDYLVKLSNQRSFLSSYKRPDSFCYTDDALLAEKCKKLLAEAQQRLSPRQREVYYLKVVKGLKTRRIAKILNIAEATALQHIKLSTTAVRNFVLSKIA